MILLPDLILRSVIRMAATDDEGTLLNNLTLLREIELEGIEEDIVGFITSITDRASKTPDFMVLRGHFDTLGKAGQPQGIAGTQRLDSLTVNTLPLLDSATFLAELDKYREAVIKRVTGEVLAETVAILGQGITRRELINGRWQPVNVQGNGPALQHLLTGISKLHSRLKRGSSGELANDADAIYREFEHAQQNPVGQYGVMSGIDVIDKDHRGLKPGDLALVAGFTSHMKTTFVMNWAYKAAIYYQKNVAVLSLETLVKDLRTYWAVLHCQHPKFFDIAVPKITTDLVEHGTLSPEQQKVFRAALDDLKQGMRDGSYGQLVYKQPDGDVAVPDIDQWAHSIHRTTPLDLLVVDYLGLVDPEKGKSGLAESAQLNRAIRATKLLATTFDKGRGIPILSPFQTNREGLKDAEKNGGKYTLRALAWANEAERSSDLVYYVYLDDSLRGALELCVGNLKARKRKVITDQFRVFADPSAFFIDNLDLSKTGQSPVAGGMFP